jgi:glutamine synthetase type III
VHKLFGRILDAIGGAMDEKGMLNLKNEIAQLQRSGISFGDDKNGYTLEFATQKILLNEFDLLSHDLNPIIFINLILAREFRNVTEELERHTRKGCKKDEAFFLVLYDLICKTRDVWDGIPKFQINNELLPGQHLPAAYAHYFKTINSPIVVDLLTHYTKDGSDRLRIIFFHKAQLYKKQIQAEIHLFRIIFSNYIEPATLEYENTFIGNLSKLQEIYGSDFLDEAMHKKAEIMEVAALLNALKNSVMQLSEYVELKCRQTDTDNLFEEFLWVDKIYRSIYKNVNQLQKTIYSGKWFS